MAEDLGIVIEGKEAAAWINIRDRIQKAIEDSEREMQLNRAMLIYSEAKIAELKENI